ncbi:6-bladed beta-propeller [Candidatus Palauibacter sp.]|uniref:6-bladed beta-propeller n=1 Tax=Candidatus Palauibacter sp. TaxID=3101350 RepID=UPI003B529C4B
MLLSARTTEADPTRILLGLTLTLALCACETESPTQNPTRETLPNGAVLVRYPGLPAIDSVGAVVNEVRVDLRFGSVEGDDPNLTFGDIRGVEAASDGTIYVLDYLAAEVRAYSPDGEYVRTVARRGEGPGEILEANGIRLSGDTLLWIHDHSQWAIMGVDPNGEEIRRFTKPVRTYGYIWTGVFDNQGRYWRSTSHSDEVRSYPPEMGVTTGSARSYYKSYDLTSGATDSVYVGERTYRSYTYSVGGGWGVRGIPFEPGEITAINPSTGFWRAQNTSYRIARTNEAGDTLIVIEAGLEEQPVTAEDRSAYVAEVAEGDPDMRRYAEEVASLMPDVKPILAGLFVDEEGRLWVRRVTPADAPAFYDLFSDDGDYLDSVRLAFEAAGPLRVRHGHIYTWIADELDVPYVVRAPLP